MTPNQFTLPIQIAAFKGGDIPNFWEGGRIPYMEGLSILWGGGLGKLLETIYENGNFPDKTSKLEHIKPKIRFQKSTSRRLNC